jgi:anti-sigma regulatory factor (Ser/Thr protein kinase)
MDQRGYVLATERYPCRADAVGRARDLAVQAYAGVPWIDREVIRLLVGEMAANAVLHSGGGEFDLICHSPVGGSVQIELHDRGSAEPERRYPTVWDSYGRGLELLDALASGWSVVKTLTGKGLILTLEADSCLTA